MDTPTPTVDRVKVYQELSEALAAADRGEMGEALFAAIDAWSYASTAEAPAYRSLAYAVRAAIEAPSTP